MTSTRVNFSNEWPQVVTKLETLYLKSNYLKTWFSSIGWPMFQVTLDLDWPEFQKKLVKNLDWLMFRLTKEKFSQNPFSIFL
jgi:hypothetical protein